MMAARKWLAARGYSAQRIDVVVAAFVQAGYPPAEVPSKLPPPPAPAPCRPRAPKTVALTAGRRCSGWKR